jgi:hypothetical protein
MKYKEVSILLRISVNKNYLKKNKIYQIIKKLLFKEIKKTPKKTL